MIERMNATCLGKKEMVRVGAREPTMPERQKKQKRE